MTTRRDRKIEQTIASCIDLINDAKLAREELVLVLAQLMIRCGYSIHWGYESTDEERPTLVNQKAAEDLYERDPSTGTTLMKIGFDLQEVLLLRKKER